eukprot:195463-Amorphochlora_amoeboformis.AAC.1
MSQVFEQGNAQEMEEDKVPPLRWSQSKKHPKVTLTKEDAHAQTDPNSASLCTVHSDEVFSSTYT